MIYLDNAATSFPKPPESTTAMCTAMRNCAGYGRSNHAAAAYSAEIVFCCRSELAELFGAESPNHVVFTLNATMALNEAIHALVPAGSRVCVSGYEHNSVIRPLVERRCVIDVVRSKNDHELLEIWKRHIQKRPACVIVNHASNVFGYLQPIAEIGKLCLQYGIPLIVDASQSAGVVDLKISDIPNCAALCMAGHKGLQGPQGTGVMVFSELLPRRALISGGTGSLSMQMEQPREIPDVFESGTMNIPGIAGLLESVRLVKKEKMIEVLEYERSLRERLMGHIESIPDLCVVDQPWKYGKLAVLSVVSTHYSCDMIGEVLSEKGVFVRTGLHCAPLAHKTEKTIASGTIRFSIGRTNTMQEIDAAADILWSVMNTF